MSTAVNIPLRAGSTPEQLSSAMDHVERDDTRVVLTRDGQPVAAIVPLHDLRALQELDEAEDGWLSGVAAEAVAEWEAAGRPPGVSHVEVARDLGIDLTTLP